VKRRSSSTYLESDAARGLRLELEFVNAEAQIERHGIRHTVIVLGSARAPERSAGYRMAREFGRVVGRAGKLAHGSRGAVITGGGPGIMAAANRGAHDVGARSIGLNIILPHEQRPNRWITPGLCLRFRYFALRKMHFLLRARAVAAFPGGFGTFDELFETLTLVQTRRVRALPIVLVGEAWWRRAFDADFLADERMIGAADRRLFQYAESAREAWDAIVRWYRRRGQAVFPPARRA
jgi:hypothetical protein